MEIMNSNTYNLMKKYMGISVESGKLIANNMANVNTKNYKRQYIDFEEALKKSSGDSNLKRTKSKHMDINSDSYEIKTDSSASMREDGNNVDIELEATDQAANEMLYNSLVRFVSGKLTTTSNVIKGGNR